MKKVLVVDDTKNIRTLLTKCLQLEGYDVKTANDGNEAVEMFIKEYFDLAFLDIKMPYFSGTEVLKQIRELGISTPVIIVTAYATVKNAVDCTNLGAVAYLQKPFTADKVRNVLNELKISKNISLSDLKETTDYCTTAEKLLQEEHYYEALNFLKSILLDKPLDSNVYLLLSKASKGLGRNVDAEKFLKLSNSINLYD